jgi:uncharacterized protein YgiM (DUF1202 family)
MTPREEDVKHNLDIIRSQLEEPAETGTGLLEENTIFLGWSLLATNALFFLALSLGLFLDREWIWWSRWMLGLMLAIAIVLHLLARAKNQGTPAIVLAPQTEVRTGPGPEFRVGFLAPEGQKVILFQTSGAWLEIGVPHKGLKGWVPKNMAEPVGGG